MRDKRRNRIALWGEKYYHFNQTEEMRIYKCVCGEKLSWYEWRKIKGRQFSFYEEWKSYVYEKNKDIPKEKLKEFYHYLEHRKRMVEPRQEPVKIMMSVVITIIVTDVMKFFLKYWKEIQALWKGGSWTEIRMGLGLIIGTFLVISLGFGSIAWMIASDIPKHTLERNFYQDYQEIIKELINEK